MKTLFFLLVLLFNAVNVFSQSGWYIQPSGTTDALFDLHFFNESTGIIVGGTAANTAVILRTTDAGISWLPVNPNTNILLRSISFINSETGIVVGGNFNLSVILKTTDSGITWDTINNPTTAALRSASFPPTATGFLGYAVGFNGVAMKTIDGGNNWSLQNTGLGTQQLFAVHFTDPDNGTAVGGTQNDTATILRTTNGGLNWIMQNPNTTNLLRGVCFTSTDNGFAVGNNGTILRTTNGGNNWSIHQTGIPGLFLRDIYFVDPVTGFICGSGGKVLKTTNGGNSWDSIPSGTNKDLQAVFFLNQNYGSCAGFDGIIIHTDSGGVITSNNDPDEFQPDRFYLSQNYPNPFNPVTVIRYSLSETRFITLKVFDIQGKELEILVSEKQQAGNYEVPFDGSKLSSGIYIYSLEAGNIELTKRMLLLK